MSQQEKQEKVSSTNKFYSIRDLAKILPISKPALYRLCKSITHYRIGKKILIAEEDVNKILIKVDPNANTQ